MYAIKKFQITLMVLLSKMAGAEKLEAAAERRKLRNKHLHAYSVVISHYHWGSQVNSDYTVGYRPRNRNSIPGRGKIILSV